MSESFRIAASLQLSTNLLELLPDITRQIMRVNEQLQSAQEAADGLSKALRGLAGVRVGAGVEQLERLAPILRSASEAQSAMAGSAREMASSWHTTASEVARSVDAIKKARGGSHLTGDDVGMASMAIGGTGALALHFARETLNQASDLGHLQAMLRTDDRVSGADVQRASDAAYGATRTATGTTQTENLRAILDLKTVTGSLDSAIGAVGQFAQLDQTLKLVAEKNGTDPAFSAAKALEILGGMYEERRGPDGKLHEQVSMAAMQHHLELMERVILATGGRIQPSDYLQYAKTSRNAGMQFSDDFTYTELPAILQVLGGQRTGTALMSLEQLYQGNHLTDKTVGALQQIGVFGAGAIQSYKDPATHRMRTRVDGNQLFERELLRTDPVKWAADVLSMLKGRGYETVDSAMAAISNPQQRATVGGLLADLIKDLPSILKEQKNILHTSPNAAAMLAATDPTAKMQQLNAAWDRLMTSLGGPLVDPAIKAMNSTSDALNRLSDWSRANPNSAKILMETVVGLGALATAVGGLGAVLWLYAPVFKLLGGLGGGASRIAGGISEGIAATPEMLAAGASRAGGLIPGALGLGARLLGPATGALGLLIPSGHVADDDFEHRALAAHGIIVGNRQSAAPVGGSSSGSGSSPSNPSYVHLVNPGAVGASVGSGLTRAVSRPPAGGAGANVSSVPTYPGMSN
ncbi:hypothetical protein FHR90_003268 [Endobacter medicaginis]|uniref:Phage tail tape measure protein n=1 Tax=Endobacter medicaginis TaxID=1181271 RepID=A0A839V3Q4_9PROT|nr:hypothetical protein [Endobacter medicaginis]MBB3175413.1 hypothetical protein [Endobacter medicaginis]MCX5476882.1 hypothetical protein [Endobacter medicaginis]NVN29577.1 hypothetical protein [Endobacter medicaginis]